MVGPIPLSEIEHDGELNCIRCGANLTVNVYQLDEDYFCENCHTVEVEEMEAEAWHYAIDNCRITHPLPEYHPENYHVCSPDEYEMGNRESYTPHALLCLCRHRYTNYEALIKGLGKSSDTDTLVYLAIRERIDEMLREAMPSLDSEVELGPDDGDE